MIQKHWVMQELYESGARTFWVMDVGPQGCLPLILSQFPHSTADLDEHGCARPFNEAVVFYNRILKEQLALLAEQLPSASIIYVDTYSVLNAMVQNAPRFGNKKFSLCLCLSLSLSLWIG
jgi:phospholipase/lecithinase/hemolysin